MVREIIRDLLIFSFISAGFLVSIGGFIAYMNQAKDRVSGGYQTWGVVLICGGATIGFGYLLYEFLW